MSKAGHSHRAAKTMEGIVDRHCIICGGLGIVSEPPIDALSPDDTNVQNSERNAQ